MCCDDMHKYVHVLKIIIINYYYKYVNVKTVRHEIKNAPEIYLIVKYFFVSSLQGKQLNFVKHIYLPNLFNQNLFILIFTFILIFFPNFLRFLES